MSISRTVMLLAGVAAAFSSSLRAQALEEIVVTAERREASLQEVPLAVSAFNTDQIKNLQIDQARDLQFYVPGLNMFNNITSPTNLSPSMRGGLQQDASLVVAESPFGIYVDDIYVGRLNGNNVRLSDIERVEVLRGPQGTLYGRNTGYGAIKFISRTPGEDFWFDASVGAGNYDQFVTSASIGGPIGDGFAGSFAAQYNGKEGDYFNIAENADINDQDNLAVRGKLRFMGAENFDAILNVSYTDSETDGALLVLGTTPTVPSDCQAFPGGTCPPGEDAQFTTDELVFPNGEWNTNTAWVDLDPPPLGDRPTGDTEQTIVGLTLAWDLSDTMTFKSITGYVGLDDFWQTDFSGNSAAAPAFQGASDISSDQWTQEFQLLGTTLNDRLSYIGGFFYLHEEADQSFGWNFITPLSTSFIDTEIDSIAVFGEATYNITDALRFTAGLRWTEDDKDFSIDFERLAGNAFGIPPTVERIELSDDYDEWTPRFVIEYTLEDIGAINSMLLYGQAAKGFKSGGFSAIALAGTDPVGAYLPETNWTYEAGLKAEWLGNSLRTNLAYYFSDVEDIQQNATDPQAAGFEFPVENSGDAEIEGLEFEITWLPFDTFGWTDAGVLTLFTNGTVFGDAEYKNINPTSAAGAANFLYGVDPVPPQVPDYAYSIGFDYTYSFNAGIDWLESVSVGADYYEIDNYITSATNDHFNAGWDIWNAYIGAEMRFTETGVFEARFEGKNLSDDFIVVSGSRGLGGFVNLPPRTFLFTVTYSYE